MLLFIFIIGCAFGSFANVIASRIPKEENFITKPSYCEICHHQLKAIDLIPIFSWIILRGRCRYCHGKFSIRYILVELASGVAFTYIFWKQQTISLLLFSEWELFLLGLITSLIDWQEQVVYPKILLVTIFLPLVQLLSNETYFSLLEKLLGVIIVTVFYGSVYLFGWFIWHEEVFGVGDIYYYTAISLWFSSKEAVVIGILAFVIGGLYCSLLYVFQKKIMKYIAFIPFIFISEIIVYVFGIAWLGW